MSSSSILFIIGEAGTAKTTRLMATAQRLLDDQKTIICLAFTHSAVNNMYRTLHELNGTSPDKSLFKTIHSYFKITPENKIRSYNLIRNDPDYILIDEFSLIPLDLVNLIFNSCKSNIILAGDLLQLNPISEKRSIKIELFENVELPGYNTDMYSSLLIASHLSNNIFSTEQYKTCNKVILTENFRSNSCVMKTLNKLLNYTPEMSTKEILENLNDIQIFDLNSEELKTYITNNNPTIISSQYKHLSKVYMSLEKPIEYKYAFNTKIGQTYYTDGTKFMLTKNITKQIHNGDIITMIGENNFAYNNKKIIIEPEDGELPLLPLNYISIHKAQGRGYDNVVVILDDLFEITMLYTAITRAKKTINFVLLDKDINKFKDNYIKIVKSFNLLKLLIYKK
jgi:ATP-dependent exoDNAse (exonuclease V) alpha subunit